MFIVPTQSGKTSAELKALGERRGFQDRNLSSDDVAKLTADEYLWFTCFFPQRISDAEQIENNKREYKETKPQLDARRMWSGKATEDESAAATKAANEFAMRYPAFVRHTENATEIARYMQEHDLDATKVENYAEAFTELAVQGLIHLSPKNAGVGQEERLTDPAEIKNYARLHLLLQPTRVLKPDDKLSADEYFAQHPELHDKRTPPLIAMRNAKKAATEEYFRRSESVTNRSGSITNLIDYKRK